MTDEANDYIGEITSDPLVQAMAKVMAMLLREIDATDEVVLLRGTHTDISRIGGIRNRLKWEMLLKARQASESGLQVDRQTARVLRALIEAIDSL